MDHWYSRKTIVLAIFLSFFSPLSSALHPADNAIISDLHITLEQFTLAKEIFTCEIRVPGYDSRTETCPVRVLFCPINIMLDQPEELETAMRECKRLEERPNLHHAELIYVRRGQTLNLSSASFGNKRELILGLDSYFNQMESSSALIVGAIFEVITSMPKPIPFLEIAFPVKGAQGKERLNYIVSPQLARAQHILQSNHYKGKEFKIAEVKLAFSKTCRSGYFPEGRCQVYTGCKRSFSTCVSCDPQSGAWHCADKSCFESHNVEQPVQCEKHGTGNASHASDGGWTAWSKPGQCHAKCGWGLETRRRQCTNPPPRGQGNACSGSAMEFKPCRQTLCLADGSKRPQLHGHQQESGEFKGDFIFHKWLQLRKDLQSLRDNPAIDHELHSLRNQRHWALLSMVFSVAALLLTLFSMAAICRDTKDDRHTARSCGGSMNVRFFNGDKKLVMMEEVDTDTSGILAAKT